MNSFLRCYLNILVVAVGTVFFTVFASILFADDGLDRNLPVIGKPIPNGINFQPPVTELARDIQWLDNVLLVIITLISIFVSALLVWVFIRYNRKANPTPSSTTHNTPIEILWTIIPVFILIGIGVISLPILLKQLRIPDSDVVIKATGAQWYWSYDYPQHNFSFDSVMLEKEELAEFGYSQDEYLLATDNPVVVPVNKNITVQVTASDVIHAWKVMSFGVHQDGVPGRLAELWFKPEKEGVYFGQCSELCGLNHSYMPIVVKVVSEEEYKDWLKRASEKFASISGDRQKSLALAEKNYFSSVD
ncbi:cytochrome c oxidase subunit II [Paracoccaceae bacterium]|nr:cytochrome c oxidase subunit II [Paracoccaceae bacterium]